jgi:hypothetical protein
MGCGASNDAVANIRRVSNVAIAPSLPSLQRQQQPPQQEDIIRHPVASQMSAGNRKKNAKIKKYRMKTY